MNTYHLEKTAWFLSHFQEFHIRQRLIETLINRQYTILLLLYRWWLLGIELLGSPLSEFVVPLI
jgi:hypothetical protein